MFLKESILIILINSSFKVFQAPDTGPSFLDLIQIGHCFKFFRSISLSQTKMQKFPLKVQPECNPQHALSLNMQDLCCQPIPCLSVKPDWLKQSFLSPDREGISRSTDHPSQVFDCSEGGKVNTSPMRGPWGDETSFQNNCNSAGGNRATTRTDQPSVD